MLTRLKVSGFKNLVDVDVRFGPFTCVAGANGVGKSNLFDAIQFLSALANQDFAEAMESIRDAGERADIRTIFHRIGDTPAETMSFEAEMITPPNGYDRLHQIAKASITFLRYKIVLAYHAESDSLTLGRLELIEESLQQIVVNDPVAYLGFTNISTVWLKSTLIGRRRTPDFISTITKNGKRVVQLHQDKSPGRKRDFLAQIMPRTVLSDANASDNPTVVVARNEMMSWRLLQLEPSGLRQPDDFKPPGSYKLQSNGANLPITLYYLAHNKPQIYAQLANRLAELIEDVREIKIDRDERRQLLTLQVTDRSGTIHPAHALSDGTLRFLALTVMELDPKATGVICLEEPENGIHPARISAMLDLLRDMATDTTFGVGEDNPLRQVIINTHSPTVVQQIHPDDLLMAELREQIKNEARFKSLQLPWLSDTWRARVNPEVRPISKGTVLTYLYPTPTLENSLDSMKSQTQPSRIIDRPDLQLSFLQSQFD